jgi:hypothetical protein
VATCKNIRTQARKFVLEIIPFWDDYSHVKNIFVNGFINLSTSELNGEGICSRENFKNNTKKSSFLHNSIKINFFYMFKIPQPIKEAAYTHMFGLKDLTA